MVLKGCPASACILSPPATPPYPYRDSDPGDDWYIPISMQFDSFDPKRVPTLQFKLICVLKACPAPACILSPLPRPPYSYQHSDPGDARYMPISMHFDSFNPTRAPTLQFKATWVLKGCPSPSCILSLPATPRTPLGIVTQGNLDICLFRCILILSTLNVC